VKKIAIFFLFFLSYGALLAHSVVPHNHHKEETVHHDGHHHHDHDENDQDEEGSLSLLLAEVVHLPGSADTYSNHTTSSFFKFSTPEFLVQVSELKIPPLIVSSPKHPPSFREERVLSFSITQASLRAPPVA
jgi:Ca2+/H+ antiporter